MGVATGEIVVGGVTGSTRFPIVGDIDGAEDIVEPEGATVG